MEPRDRVFFESLQNAYQSRINNLDKEVSTWSDKNPDFNTNNPSSYPGIPTERIDRVLKPTYIGFLTGFLTSIVLATPISQQYSIGWLQAYIITGIVLSIIYSIIVYVFNLFATFVKDIGNNITRDKRIEELMSEIKDLKLALQQLKQQSFVTSEPEESDVDCNHLIQLLKIHQDALKVLEIKQAKLSISLPVHETIEIQTRETRIIDLKKLLKKHCSGNMLRELE